MKKKFLLFLALLAPLASAQNLSQPILQPHVTFVDASGSPCAGCTLASFAAGTTTPQPTYTSAVISVPTQNTNPVVLDAAGGATIWLSLSGYKFVLKDTGGTTLWTVDNVVSVASLGCLGNNQISKGCTGATTSQGAATNIVDTNNIKPASVLNSNVNGVFTITKYGAVGDCTPSGSVLTSNVIHAGTACTDNRAAIQAAVDAAYAVGGAVYIPTNPASPTQTVYYISDYVNPKGVSIYGDAGAMGAFQNPTAAMKVAVRGAVGKDILHIVQTGAAGFVDPWISWTIKDIGLILDTSSDVSSSFPTRLVGRTCNDGSMDGSTAILTSAAQCEFQPGDVGQKVFVGGAGIAGTATIISYQSPTQVTLSLASNTPGSGLTIYVSAVDLSVTQSIGNCAFAMDDSNAAYAPGFNPDFEDIVIQTNGSHYLNYGCGFFFQGNAAPYFGKFHNIFVGVPFAFAFVPANGVSASSGNYTGIADLNTFSEIWMQSQYPWISYNGFSNTMRGVQVATGGFGPQWLSSYGAETLANNWIIDWTEQEYVGGSCSTSTAFRISGVSHIFPRLSAGGCGTQAFQWDADSSNVNWMILSNGASFNVTGKLNTFKSTSYADAIGAMTYNNTNSSNTLQTGTVTNPFAGLQPARSQYAFKSSSAFGPPGLSRGSVTYNRTHDFIGHGASAYYFNDEDLWFWPGEMANGVAGNNPTVAADTDSPTGQNFKIASGAGQYLGASNGTRWYLGSQFPLHGRIYIWAKAASTTNVSILAQAYYSATWNNVSPSPCTVSVASASYALYSCDYDASGLSGDQFLINISAATVDTYVGWVGIRPYDSAPFGNYSSTLAHQIVAVWNGASGTLVDDSEGGSGYQSGNTAWGTTITGTYYVQCTSTGFPGGSTLGRRIVATAVGVPVDGSNFTYAVDTPTISATRGSTLPSVTCFAIQ